MKKLGFLFGLLLCCTLAFTQTIFLDAGPSVPTDAAQGQPVLSYSFGLADADGEFHDLSLTMVNGIMSPELLLAVATGTGYAKMELKVYNSENKITRRITMQDVMVTTIQFSGLEVLVTLSFSKAKVKDFNH
jgi:hypothetical protein